MQAARGSITKEKKDSNVASKILLNNGQPADTIMKKMDGKQEPPWEREEKQLRHP